MTRRPPPAPSADALHEAALAHLARYAATERQLLRVLTRRIERWARAAAAGEPEAAAETARRARADAAVVVQRLVAAGAVNDAAFAAARAARLARSGHSRRAIGAHLAAKGVGPETARAVVPDDAEAELDAALATARRRRMGPFRAAEADAEMRRREAAALTRAGFPLGVALKALRMGAEEAAARLAGRRNLTPDPGLS